jgi:plasmid stability protein
MWHMQIGTLDPVKTIQIRNVPDEIHQALRSRAAAAGASLSDFALEELAIAAERPPIAEVLKRAGERPGGGVTVADAVAAVRSGRDRA